MKLWRMVKWAVVVWTCAWTGFLVFDGMDVPTARVCYQYPLSRLADRICRIGAWLNGEDVPECYQFGPGYKASQVPCEYRLWRSGPR